MPSVKTYTPIEHCNMSNRETDWFAGRDELREKCEKSYAIDMALYGTAKNCTITLEEAIDRWRLENQK